MRLLSAIIVIALLLSCKNEQRNRSTQEQVSPSDPDTIANNTSSPEIYSGEQWEFQVQVPSYFEVEELQLPGETPVVNIYDTTNVQAPPYAIHEEASLAYIALLPEGYGVDAPAGKRVSYGEWQQTLDVPFDIDEEQSVIYLLEDDEEWAYSLTPKNLPQGWNEYASIFVHFKVHNFEAECFSVRTGEEKTMSDCQPMGGEDEVRYSGELDPQSEEDLMEILSTLRFD